MRQANIPKISEGTPARKQGKRIFIDISSIMYPSAGGKKHWLLIVDEATDYSHSIFLMDQNLGKKHHIYIKKIKLDNSGENRMLQAKADQENLGIKFEFTAPGTAQQNSGVERKFPQIM